jgi:hypothetical protein
VTNSDAARDGGRWRDLIPGLLLITFVIWEAYELTLGDLLQVASRSPSILLYLAVLDAIYAAWLIVQLECFPRLGNVSRKSQIWFVAALNLACAALIVLWLHPRLAVPLIILLFALADLTSFQIARDLLARPRQRSQS